MNSNTISNLDTPSDPGDAAPRSWINSNDDVIPDTTIPDDQPLADVLNEGNTANQDLDMGGNNIDNIGSRGSSITIGDPTGVHGIQDSDFYGIDVARDTDQAYFGLRNYGDDSDDVVINNEQTSDDIRIQSDGNDRLIIRGGGNIDITSGNLRMNGNDIRFDDGSASISQNADSDVVIQGRDPDQRLELTDDGFLRYKEYHGSNTVFQIRSQGSNDGRVELKGDTELDINGDLIDGVTEIYGSSGNDVTFQNRPRSQDGLYVQSGTAYFNGEVRTDVIQDRGGGNTIRTDSNIQLNGNHIRDDSDNTVQVRDNLLVDGRIDAGSNSIETVSGRIESSGSDSSGVNLRFKGQTNELDIEKYNDPSVDYVTVGYNGGSAEVTAPNANVNLRNSRGFQLPVGTDAY